MGKARRARQKLHLPASGVPRRPEPDAEAVPETVPVAGPPPPSGASPFAGLQIPPEALRQRLPDFDARSVRSETARSVRSTKSTVRGQAAMKKKDKRKVRREAFMQKLDSVMESLRSARAAKRRRATAVVGDMRPLADALPDPVLLEKERAAKKAAAQQRRQPSQKRRGMPKQKALHKQYLSDIAQFQRVLEHPIYQEDPEGIVSEHVQQWVLKDAEGMEV
ncbi:Protein FAM207A [Amphibalanus amphitrite]|uniref:Protein FAM207A n=1 Tax=Amphibalanus amphitrite TaxID=1232801 RepID=A0A6A4X2V6_AMPAM|nr:Protein FAM207A [Amphibalanus amphitrite]